MPTIITRSGGETREHRIPARTIQVADVLIRVKRVQPEGFRHPMYRAYVHGPDSRHRSPLCRTIDGAAGWWHQVQVSKKHRAQVVGVVGIRGAA